MKMQAELLGKLHRLSSRDRAWIVERLSEQERTQLMSTLAAPQSGSAVANRQLHAVEPQSRMEPKSADAVKTLARIEPRLVAMITKNEPAWLNAVIVAAQHPAWSKAFLDALPAVLRADMEKIQPRNFGAELTECSTRLILARCQGNLPAESAFDRLVERLASSRSRKRMTLQP